jgi:hypothetical protein
MRRALSATALAVTVAMLLAAPGAPAAARAKTPLLNALTGKGTSGAGTGAVKTSTATTPTGAASAPSGAITAPATGASATPTTTYAPSGSTPLPAGSPAPTQTATATTPLTGAAPARVGAASAPKKKSSGGHISTGAIIIGVLAALLALACAAWALARSRAYEPKSLPAMRHSLAEARFRASATWSELLDWARLGR